MQFKHPEILYALLLLLIPIIVHLFQLRKFKKEAFTNVAFLKKITLQTRKSSIIKKWLTLITRLLLLAAIIFAFAQPFTSKTNSFNKEIETVIYLDNSFSMQAKGTNGELLKRAVNDILNSVPEDEVLNLVTNNSTFKNTTLKAIKNELLQLNYSPNQIPYEAALLKSKTFFKKNHSSIKNLIFISDFQQNASNFLSEKDSLVNLNLVQLKPVNQENVTLDSIYISSITASTINLKISLKNQGETLEDLPVSLYNNDNLIAKTSVSFSNSTTTDFSLPINEQIRGKASINDANLQFDNNLFFSINTNSKINVLTINNANDSFLKRVFSDDEFNYESNKSDALNYNNLDKQHLIILNELESIPNSLATVLNNFTSKGGFVIVIPSVEANLPSYSSFLGNILTSKNNSEKRITTIRFSHPIFNGVFSKRVTNFQYPKVNSFYNTSSIGASSILQFEDSSPFLLQNKNVFLFTSALNTNNSNFTNSPLIVPTLYNIGKHSLKIPQLYFTVGEENTYDVATALQNDDILSLKSGEINTIPRQQLFSNKVVIETSENPEKAGIYTVNNGQDIITEISYNYSRKESDLVYINPTESDNIKVSNSISQAFEEIKSNTSINELWKWFIIFALLFLIIEMLILKYFK